MNVKKVFKLQILVRSASRAGAFQASTFRLASHVPNSIRHSTSLGNNVLLVGEGDFSYAADLCEANPKGLRLLATTLDSPEDLMTSLFPASAASIAAVERANGARVEYEVDATRLGCSTEVASRSPFDVVRFNFPHVRGKSNTRGNRELLTKFLASAAPLLKVYNEPSVWCELPAPASAPDGPSRSRLIQSPAGRHHRGGAR